MHSGTAGTKELRPQVRAEKKSGDKRRRRRRREGKKRTKRVFLRGRVELRSVWEKRNLRKF